MREMGRFKFTAITGVNTLFNALLNDPEFARLDFSHLKLVLGGGMAVQEVVGRGADAVECVVREGVVAAMNRYNGARKD